MKFLLVHQWANLTKLMWKYLANLFSVSNGIIAPELNILMLIEHLYLVLFLLVMRLMQTLHVLGEITWLINWL